MCVEDWTDLCGLIVEMQSAMTSIEVNGNKTVGIPVKNTVSDPFIKRVRHLLVDKHRIKPKTNADQQIIEFEGDIKFQFVFGFSNLKITYTRVHGHQDLVGYFTMETYTSDDIRLKLDF